MPEQTLIERLKNKQSIIGVIGLGYVGLPLVLRFAEVGFQVKGFDIDAHKIELLQKGQSYIHHIAAERLQAALDKGLMVTTDYSHTVECDAIIICVPTPLNKNREPDLSYIQNTLTAILPYLRKGQVLSLESTTYPGTVDELIKSQIEAAGFVVGEELFLVYSPERENPGSDEFLTHEIPKVCGGVTPACLLAGKTLYSQVMAHVVPVSSTKVAEMSKLLENIFRAVNIGLINEMKIIADRMDIDIYEVIHAAATKPFGFMPHYPGPGLGGHCIPIDPFYLTWKAREYGVRTRFIELAGEINAGMPRWVVDKLSDALNQRGKALKGSKVLMLGITYKKNVDDMRESPAVVMMEILQQKGAEIAYSDPFVPVFPPMREHHFDLHSLPVTEDTLRSVDAVLVATAHDAFDLAFIQAHANLIVDARGVYPRETTNVVRA